MYFRCAQVEKCLCRERDGDDGETCARGMRENDRA
jgi:hypothetical protein